MVVNSDSKQSLKGETVSYLFILLGSMLYAAGTVIFVFPCNLLLGGTSAISVILHYFLPFSPGVILTALNTFLILLAFLILGRDMAIKNFVGSVLTTFFTAIFEKIFVFGNPLSRRPFVSAIAGASVIAVAGGVMFYCRASSGGTDIIALIIRKYRKIDIGKALLITDVFIVLAGGFLAGKTILFSSLVGLFIKTFGIDFVISKIRKSRD